MLYIKKISSKDEMFSERKLFIIGADSSIDISRCDIPSELVLCDACNTNIYPNDGYLIYTSKSNYKNNLPWGIVCEKCIKNFKKQKYIEVS